MTETISDGPGPRHAFAPHPDPVEGMLHRIYIIFKESDGRLWASGTDMMRRYDQFGLRCRGTGSSRHAGHIYLLDDLPGVEIGRDRPLYGAAQRQALAAR